MQELMMQGMHKKLQKSCFRCKKTLDIESSHILQHPKYLIIIFGDIIRNVNKNMCTILFDMQIMIGSHNFSLHASIKHQVP